MPTEREGEQQGARPERRAAALLRVARAWWLDITLALAGALLTAHTLFFPFERDQGLYFYVGRAWMHGALPYRDVFDQKTPLIYVIYGLVWRLFGDRFWGIRLAEWLWCLGVGWALGAALSTRTARPSGLRGFGAFCFATALLVPMPYWGTGECESWAAGFVVLACAALLRDARLTRSMAVCAGLSVGAAVMAKPTALASAVFLVPWALWRVVRAAPSWRARLALVGWAALGAALPPALLLGGIAAAGGAADMFDVLVRCNRYHTDHIGLSDAPRELSEGMWRNQPFASLGVIAALAGVLYAALSRRWSWVGRHLVALGVVLGGVASIYWQNKWWLYHWGHLYLVSALPVVLLAAQWLEGDRRLRPAGAALVPMALAFAWVQSTAVGPYQHYLDTWQALRDSARGRVTRSVVLDVMSRGTPFSYNPAQAEAIGGWLRAHARPGDTLANRNFETAIHLVSGLDSPTRFFWTPWLAWTNWDYRRAEWLAQDRAMMRRAPPRFIVAVTRLTSGVESPAHYEPDYRRVFQYGELTVLERATEHPASSPMFRP